jgi:hypothetical protein
MTRGYVVIFNGKEITSAMYHNSDSYLSYLGLIVLEHFKNDSLLEFINEYNKENPDYKEDIDGINMDWLIKDKKTSGGYYVDYAYVYDSSKKTLTIYNYGDLAFKIKSTDYEIAKFVFENDYALYKKWAFDKTKLEYMSDNYKIFRAMLRRNALLQEYKEILDSKVNSFYVESGRLKENFHTSDYMKIVKDVDTEKELKFLIKKSTFYGEKVDIYLKLPFGNVYIGKSSSDKAADKQVKKCVKENQELLSNVLGLISIIDEYKEMLNKYMFIKKNYSKASENSMKQLEEILEKINKYKKENILLKHSSSSYNEKYIRSYLEQLRKTMLNSENN